MTDTSKRLRSWADLVSSGYEVPAAGQVMFEAAKEMDEDANLICELVLVLHDFRVFQQERSAYQAAKQWEALEPRIDAVMGKATKGTLLKNIQTQKHDATNQTRKNENV